MSHIPWASLILLDKKITTDSVRYHTHRPMSSLYAFPSHRRHRSRTFERNGFRRSTTTALACLA
jgi:hypothetical protein